MESIIRNCLITGICLLCSLTSSGQDEYIFDLKQFGPEDGLPHREVNAVFEDNQGFIWAGTREGLCRFDGYEFLHFPASKYGFETNNFNYIFQDKEGLLWLVPPQPYEEIDLFDPLTFETQKFSEKYSRKQLTPANNRLISLVFQDPKGEMYLHNIEKNSLWHCHSDGTIDEINLPANVENIVAITDIIWAQTSGDRSISRFKLNGDLIDQRKIGGNFLIEKRPVQFNLPIVGIESLQGDIKGNAYLVQNSGYKILDGIYDASLIAIRDWGESGTDSLWFWYLKKIIDSKGNLIKDLEQLGVDNLESIPRSTLIDSRGRVWLGMNFGLYLLDIREKRFTNFHVFPISKVVGDRAFRSIYVRDGNLFVQFENRGLFRINLESGNHKHLFKGISRAYYVAATPFGENKVVVSHKDSLIILNEETGEVLLKKKLGSIIWHIVETGDGQFWVGTEDGPYLFDSNNGTFRKFTKEASFQKLANACVYKIREVSDSEVWVCSDAGYFKMDVQKGILEHYFKNGKGNFHLPADIVFHEYVDNDGTIWLATNSGLFHLEEDQDGTLRVNKHFTRAEGLSHNVIYAVYPEGNNALWLPSDFGLMRLDKESGKVITYLESDGISNNEFNRVSHYQDEDGRMYFGTIDGLTSFHPDELKNRRESESYKMVITKYLQFDGDEGKIMDRTSELQGNRTITLRPSDRYFQIKFSLLSFQDVDKNNYSYKIEGVDEDWQYIDDNTLRFGQLPYGNHTLYIRGQDASGHWSSHMLEIPIRVVRPIYFQTWFIILGVLLLGGLVVAYFQYRTYQLRKRNLVLEERVKERTQTIQQQAIELAELDRLKSRFFANVSHELRTPLTLMLGPVTNLLKRGEWNKRDRNMLELVHRNASLLLKLVNEILDLSKLEKGKLELVETPVRLFDFLKPITTQFSSFSDSERVQFSFDYQPDENLTVLLDKDKFEKIIHNFLSNALKFTPLGGKVKLVVEQKSEDLLFRVVDTGPGIHPEDLPNVFDRFYQSKKTNTGDQGGTGIGLSLCKELATLLGGEVWAESEFGLGSAFFLKLPLKTAEHESVGDHSESPEAGLGIPKEIKGERTRLVSGEDDPKKPHILIVEDNQDLQAFLSALLGDQYRIDTADNGKEGLQLLSTGPTPDMIISDVMMPVMDGIKMLERIKSDAKWKSIPFIMLTARSDVKVKVKALRIGIDDYILKPFDEEELIARIENILSFARARGDEKSTLAEVEKSSTSGTSSSKGEDKSGESEPVAEDELEWLETVEAITREHLQHFNFNADYLASQLNISSRQLQRVLKKLTGLTINQYIQEARLQQAREILESSQTLVKQAAAKVGYKDVKYFTALYKKRFGKVPSSE